MFTNSGDPHGSISPHERFLSSLAGVRERFFAWMQWREFGFLRDKQVFQKRPIRVRCGGHMLAKLLDAVFGCWHVHYSFPITPRHRFRRTKAASLTGTYVVCLECGTELPYDWNTMKIVSCTGERSKLAPSLASMPGGYRRFTISSGSRQAPDITLF
jgi:hypothetical protein